jgi:TonB family protein
MKYFLAILPLLLSLNSLAQNAGPNAAGVYEKPEVPAYFAAGRDSLDRFIKHNIHLKHSGNDKVNNAVVVFLVEKDGHIGTAEILRTSGDKDFDSEAVAIVKAMPKWIPAKDKGEVVRSSNMLAFSYLMK